MAMINDIFDMKKQTSASSLISRYKHVSDMQFMIRFYVNQ